MLRTFTYRLGPAVGIDVGLKSILSLSDGTGYDNPRWHKETMPRLRRAQRRLARRKRGSHRRRKAAAVVARLHERVANQRRDFWHKTTRELANTFSHIAVEALTLGFMTRSRTLARSAHDAGLGMFRPMLDYKAEEWTH